MVFKIAASEKPWKIKSLFGRLNTADVEARTM